MGETMPIAQSLVLVSVAPVKMTTSFEIRGQSRVGRRARAAFRRSAPDRARCMILTAYRARRRQASHEDVGVAPR